MNYTVIYGSDVPIVHRTGCADIKREARRAGGGTERVEGTLTDVAATAWIDCIREGSMTVEDALADLIVKPCAR